MPCAVYCLINLHSVHWKLSRCVSGNNFSHTHTRIRMKPIQHGCSSYARLYPHNVRKSFYCQIGSVLCIHKRKSNETEWVNVRQLHNFFVSSCHFFALIILSYSREASFPFYNLCCERACNVFTCVLWLHSQMDACMFDMLQICTCLQPFINHFYCLEGRDNGLAHAVRETINTRHFFFYFWR